MKTKTVIIAALACGVVLVALRPLRKLLGCGPFFEQTVFVQTHVPDQPLAHFAAGNLGVVQPTYFRVYLYISYRYLDGKPFNERERQALEVLWNNNARHDWMNLATQTNEDADIKVWLDVSRTVAGVGPTPKVEVYRGGFWDQTNYIGYLNCPGDAFRNAAQTLADRIAKFGAASPFLADWVEAQDKVFANCNGAASLPKLPPPNWLPPEQKAALAKAEAAGVSVPPPAGAETPPLLRADRAYQIAAANFYAGNFDQAQEQFEAIAKDSSSPWHELAPYLVARTLVRKATLTPGAGEIHESDLKQAQEQLDQILDNQSLARIHPAAKRLLHLVWTKLDPLDYLHIVARAIVEPGDTEDLTQNIKDYTALLDKALAGPAYQGARDLKPLPETSGSAHENDLTDWILTFQSDDLAAFSHSMEKWRKKKSLPWLVAVITRIKADDPHAGEVIAAAEEVPSRSPAYLTLAYHTIRLLAQSGKNREARLKLDKLIAQRNWKDIPSARNLFLAQRMGVARNLDEFLRFAPRVISSFISDGMSEQEQVNLDSNPRLKELSREQWLLDTDSTRILNEGMPLELLSQAALSPRLPPHLHRDLAVAVWLRAFLLGSGKTALDLLPVVEKAAPELKIDLEKYRSTRNEEAREFEGVEMMLDFPGLRPYVMSGAGRAEPLDQFSELRENWWCPLVLDLDFDQPNFLKFTPYYTLAQPSASAPANHEPHFAPFLTSGEKSETRHQLQRLASLGPAPDYLAPRVIAWAEKHPDDPRVPQALYIVVHMPHTGCTDARTGSYSHAAFRLLHARYPKNPWTSKARYWYR